MSDGKEIATIADERSVAEVRNQVQKIQQLMRDVMQDGQHFGKVPGCGEKPTLLKPGAEKLCFTFRVAPEFQIVREDLSNGHREYQITCRLRSMTTGDLVGEGVGSASTMESKYRWRNAGKVCPSCGKETIIAGKAEYGGGWLCYAKKGGCGAKFDSDDPAITSQPVGKVENPDIADVYNTVLKIAKKRAHVDATITAFAASDIFTQDVEDFVRDDDNARYAEDATHTTSGTRSAKTAAENPPDNFKAKSAENAKKIKASGKKDVDEATRDRLWTESNAKESVYWKLICMEQDAILSAPARHEEKTPEGNGDLFGDPIQDLYVELENWLEDDRLPSLMREDIRSTLESGEKDVGKLTALIAKVKDAAGK